MIYFRLYLALLTYQRHDFLVRVGVAVAVAEYSANFDLKDASLDAHDMLLDANSALTLIDDKAAELAYNAELIEANRFE